MESPEELAEKLRALCASGVREQLIAKGLARGMVWDGGVLPEDSPKFSSLLTNNLLNHGYLVLGCSIRLRMLAASQSIPEAAILSEGFRTAAECIEAVVRRGEHRSDRGFHLTVAAAAFHLGQYGARSFSLLAEDTDQLNLAAGELLLVALMQRQLARLQELCRDWLNAPENTDDGIAASLESLDNDFDAADAAYTAINRVFHRGIATFDFALRTGSSKHVDSAKDMLDRCIEAADHLKHVPLWWIVVLARHLIDDLWDRSLYQRLPLSPNDSGDWPELRERFIKLVGQRNIAEIDLWPSQLEAAQRVVDENDNLVVALPTSSGKTRIAELCVLRCLSGGRRVVYVTPLRALSAQVEVTLSRTFKPLGFTVSSVYGASGLGASDVETMKSASIVVATPEKLDFAIRQDARVIDDVGLIVLDEGHMIGLSEREIRYEVLVQRLLRRTDANGRRIVCLSAIFTEGNPFDAFTAWIRLDREGAAIRSDWRPTRQRPATLEWRANAGRLEYRVQGEAVFVPRFIEQRPAKGQRKNPFPQNRQELIVATIDRFHREGHAVLLYCPIRRSVEPTADSFLKLVRQGYAKSFLADSGKEAIEAALRIGKEWLGNDHVAMHALRLGVAVHHAQLPRPFLAELEHLLRRRILTLAISSPTLAQGVDLSFSVLIFTSLWRNQRLLPAKEFANVIGRVGRAYVDLDGIFVLPVHEKNAGKSAKRLGEFHQLVRDARGRELESGLYLLIRVCLLRLKEKLGIEGKALEEYVLNQQTALDKLTDDNDEHAEQLELILAELDAGIFALVEELDCEASQIASKLDDALQSSLWTRRLAVRDLEEQEIQRAMLHGRARHIWTQTTTPQRRGFFAASIGTESGLVIVEQHEVLRQLLEESTDAIKAGDVVDLVAGCSGLAERLFAIYPFLPSMPTDWTDDTWRSILATWISGAALSELTDSAGIAFVQDALIYRLVWAIEAVRVVLSSLDEQEEVADSEDERSCVAICMTYGVPYLPAARMLESGLESRLLAVRLTSELALTFTSLDGLLAWLETVRDNEPIAFSETERAAWQQFLQKNDRSYERWRHNEWTLSYTRQDDVETSPGDGVRLIPGVNGITEIYTPDCGPVGTSEFELPGRRVQTGTIKSDGEITVSAFGPSEIPAWMKRYLTSR